MKSNIQELDNLLSAQLRRLSDTELTGDRLKEEITRSDAVTNVARESIATKSLILKMRLAFPGMLED